ncbi:MAG: alpha/beta hydrolase [Myxococcales bacterium]|nr:alpha/beta hydrolase [Myxococcales bacterium]
MVEHLIPSYDGTRIFYEDQGEGPVLVLCDGIGCDGYAWKYVYRDCGDRYRLIHWHYRAHGKSDDPEDRQSLSMRHLCRDLEVVLDHAGVESGVFLGHSMGVQVILEFYHLYPERVRGLVPICGSYGHPINTFGDNKGLRLIFPLIFEMFMRYPDTIKQVWQRAIHSELAWQIAIRTEVDGNFAKKEDFLPYLEHISRINLANFAQMLYFASVHSAEPYLEQIAVPTLIIAGERDGFTPRWLSEVMEQRVPKATLRVIPNGTHTAPIERPDLIVGWLEEFLPLCFEEREESPAL